MKRFGTIVLCMGLWGCVSLVGAPEAACKECAKASCCSDEIRDWLQKAVDEEQNREEAVKIKAREHFLGMIGLIDGHQDSKMLDQSELRDFRANLSFQRKHITNLFIKASLINEQLADKLGLPRMKGSQAAALFVSGSLAPYSELDAEDLMLITRVGNLYWLALEAKLLATRIMARARRGTLTRFAKEQLQNAMTNAIAMQRRAIPSVAARVESLSRKRVYKKPEGYHCIIANPAINSTGLS